MTRLRLLVLLCSILVASSAAAARAAVVTVGSPLLGSVVTAGQTYNETNVNLALGGPAQVTSPVSGAIVGWHLLGYEGGPFSLRVLRPAGSTAYTGVGTSSPVVAASPALQTFATDLPIQAGETIGLDVTKGSKIGVITAGAPLRGRRLEPAVARRSDPALRRSGFPAASSPSTPKFSRRRRSRRCDHLGSGFGWHRGDDFRHRLRGGGCRQVRVDAGRSPTRSIPTRQITATSPAGTSAPAVPISVTTIAGTAISSQPFAYQAAGPPAPVAPMATPVAVSHCVVPNLAGKKLNASRRAIKAADCKLGKITKRKGVKPVSAKVVGQSKKPGTVLPAGSVVKVTLGPGRTPRS